VELVSEQLLLMAIIARIRGLAAVAQTVEGRHRQKQVTVLNEFRHLPVKKGH